MFNLDPMRILFSLPAVFLALSFHEFAHAFTADKMGDDTPRRQGRLTLDPLAHVDWIGLILFAVAGFGWAKPVQVNPSHFKHRKWGEILVSAAGPAANFLLAFAAVLLYFVLLRFWTGIPEYAKAILFYIIYLNIVFTILNLLPIPPFDGYHVLKNLFFRQNVKFFWKVEQYSMYILMAVVFLGVFRWILLPPTDFLYRHLMDFGHWLTRWL